MVDVMCTKNPNGKTEILPLSNKRSTKLGISPCVCVTAVHGAKTLSCQHGG